MAALTVFGLPAQAETARVLTCLFEKDLSFGLVHRDSYKARSANGRTEHAKYVQEPTGQVMVMEDGNGTMVSAGSRDICRHICVTHPRSGNLFLLGAGDLERASIEDWNRRESQLFDPLSTSLILQLAFLPGGHGFPASVEEDERRLAEVLDGYEERLAERQYLADDKFSLADLFHLPNTAYLYRTELGYDMINERVNVCRWWETISSRDSWKMVQDMQKQPRDFQHSSNMEQNSAEMLMNGGAMHEQHEGYEGGEHPIPELDPYSRIIIAGRAKPKRDANPPVQPEEPDDRSGRRIKRKSSIEPYKKKTKGGGGKPSRK